MSRQHVGGAQIVAEVVDRVDLSARSGLSGDTGHRLFYLPYRLRPLIPARMADEQELVPTGVSLGKAVGRARSRRRQSTLSPRGQAFALRTFESPHTLRGLPDDPGTSEL